MLVVTMRERGVREGLVGRTEEIMREIISRVRIGGEMGKGFWTARGVRLGGGRVYTLAYADDLVLLAEGEEEIRSTKVGGLLG